MLSGVFLNYGPKIQTKMSVKLYSADVKILQPDVIRRMTF